MDHHYRRLAAIKPTFKTQPDKPARLHIKRWKKQFKQQQRKHKRLEESRTEPWDNSTIAPHLHELVAGNIPKLPTVGGNFFDRGKGGGGGRDDRSGARRPTPGQAPVR